MKLQFRKGKNANTFTCIRDDGTQSWTKLHPGIEDHDLAHYAVEKHLEFREAFLGIVNQGYEIGDFALPRDQRPLALWPVNLPLQAQQTEFIVNLLQTEYWNSGINPNFLTTLRTTLDLKEMPFPARLNEERLELIRKDYHELIARWKELPLGETLELSFP